MRSVILVTALAAGVSSFAFSAEAAGNLNLICSADVVICEQMKNMFEKDTGTKVNMVRLSSGETYAKVRAEARNPKTDIWWAGTGDPHLQAAAEGLTLEYKSPMLDQLQDWAKTRPKVPVSVLLVFMQVRSAGVQHRYSFQKKLKEPKCWADLLDASYKDEIQMANPNSSGTAYTALATLVQIMGKTRPLNI